MLELCKVDLFSYINDEFLVGKRVGLVRQVVSFIEIERISCSSVSRRMVEEVQTKFPCLGESLFLRGVLELEEPSSVFSLREFEEGLVIFFFFFFFF